MYNAISKQLVKPIVNPKIFIAEEAGNPKLNEIKIAMRKYCDEQYKLGKTENFERLCKIKPVFEKLFGT